MSTNPFPLQLFITFFTVKRIKFKLRKKYNFVVKRQIDTIYVKRKEIKTSKFTTDFERITKKLYKIIIGMKIYFLIKKTQNQFNVSLSLTLPEQCLKYQKYVQF